jgi:hypothetical protein
MDQCIYICTFPLLYFPLLPPSSTYLAPSSCDRNRPPRSQVVCKLPPFVPLAPSCPPFQNPNPLSDFPEPNVHLIKALLNPLPSIQNSIPQQKKTSSVVSHNRGKYLPLWNTMEEVFFVVGYNAEDFSGIRFCCGVGYNGRQISCVMGY